MKRLAPLLAYLPWHARDALGRAAAPLVIALGIIGIPIYAFIGASAERSIEDPRSADMALGIYNNGLPLALTLGAIVLMNQVIALDREKQHFRFLLAHPVAAWEYYLQRFIVGLALFAAFAALIPVVFSALVVDVSVVGVVRAAALQGLLYGAIAALCGVLWQKDGLALIVIVIVAQIMQDLKKAEQLVSWLEPVARALPPVGSISAIRSQWLVGAAADQSELLFIIAYGVGTLAVALFLVKRLPLAR